MTQGIREYLTIDGADVPYNPSEITVSADEVGVSQVELTGDSVLFYHQPLAGLPDRDQRYTFSLPYPSLSSDADLRWFRRLAALSGEISFCYWKPANWVYTADASQVSFYLPRHRQIAPSILGASLTDFPVYVWRNGTAQTVTVVGGAVVTTPASGSCNIATAAATTGDYRDYVEFRLSACSAGDLIEIEFVPLFWVRVVQATENYPGSFREERGLTLQER